MFPLNGILDLDDVREEQWEPLQAMVVIYALFPNIVLSATIANGELFRVYPSEVAGPLDHGAPELDAARLVG